MDVWRSIQNPKHAGLASGFNLYSAEKTPILTTSSGRPTYDEVEQWRIHLGLTSVGVLIKAVSPHLKAPYSVATEWRAGRSPVPEDFKQKVIEKYGETAFLPENAKPITAKKRGLKASDRKPDTFAFSSPNLDKVGKLRELEEAFKGDALPGKTHVEALRETLDESYNGLGGKLWSGARAYSAFRSTKDAILAATPKSNALELIKTELGKELDPKKAEKEEQAQREREERVRTWVDRKKVLTPSLLYEIDTFDISRLKPPAP